MFDIGWSELMVIAAVALIAIGPKELPGTLRMIGQWMGKARRMASEFQGQFQEAMREAEVAEMKQQFDDLSKQADSYNPTKILEDAQKDVESTLKLDDTKLDDTKLDDTAGVQPATTPEAAAPVTPVVTEPPVVTDAPPSAGDGKPS
jgi:sec-independent protein translocase protein TatB